MRVSCMGFSITPYRRTFSTSSWKSEIRYINDLSDRIRPSFQETPNNDLLSLQWPLPPRNILLVKKDHSLQATAALLEFAKHVYDTYKPISLLLEADTASSLHTQLPCSIYVHPSTSAATLSEKVDLTATFGGDGTILHASSLFATEQNVPPLLSFSMGTLGFLGEWKFGEYKRAFREVYGSGIGLEVKESISDNEENLTPGKQAIRPGSCSRGWPLIQGKEVASSRGARVLLRNRLRVSIHSASSHRDSSSDGADSVYAMNEVIIHRGAEPHLAVIEVYVGGRFLTEAVADGMIISTPTGSTAYSLSSGGSIVHPLVSSLLLTPICPRSLSFRPLVLPANTPITLRLSEKNRGRKIDVSIDGRRKSKGLGAGMEIRVRGEEIQKSNGQWSGGVPCVMRGNLEEGANSDEGWVGGLNGLLKFNYPFGEEG